MLSLVAGFLNFLKQHSMAWFWKGSIVLFLRYEGLCDIDQRDFYCHPFNEHNQRPTYEISEVVQETLQSIGPACYPVFRWKKVAFQLNSLAAARFWFQRE